LFVCRELEMPLITCSARSVAQCKEERERERERERKKERERERERERESYPRCNVIIVRTKVRLAYMIIGAIRRPYRPTNDYNCL